MLKFNLEPQASDLMNIGAAEGAEVSFSAPTFAPELSAWECAFSIEGSDRTFTSKLYGVSELQAIELVIGFISKMTA